MKHDDHTFKHEISTVQVWDEGPSDFAVHVESIGSHTGYLPKTDAPALALAILKAAGYEPAEVESVTVGTVGHVQHIAKELADCVAYSKQLEEAESRDKRRDELARELFSSSVGEAPEPGSPMGRAIDRIIELEAKASS